MHRSNCATRLLQGAKETQVVTTDRTLHLISDTGAKPAPEPSNTRLTVGEYIADILVDTRFHAKIAHWVVQRVGSPKIIQWGQEYTFEDAVAAAQSYLEGLAERDEPKRA